MFYNRNPFAAQVRALSDYELTAQLQNYEGCGDAETRDGPYAHALRTEWAHRQAVAEGKDSARTPDPAEIFGPPLPPSASQVGAATALRLSLHRNGYSPLPITAPGNGNGDGKRPAIAGWQDFCRRQPTEAEIQGWESWPGTGIACGDSAGQACAVDVDISDPELAKQAAAIVCEVTKLDTARAILRFGRWPKFLIVFQNDGSVRSAARKLANDHGVDILAGGRQFVAYGDHPGTKRPYAWFCGGAGCAGVSVVGLASLPTLSNAQAREILRRLVSLIGEAPRRDGAASRFGAGGEFPEIIHDGGGKVVDGRDTFMAKLAEEAVLERQKAAGAPPDDSAAEELADVVWRRFCSGVATLARGDETGDWSRDAALPKVRRNIRRAREGKIRAERLPEEVFGPPLPPAPVGAANRGVPHSAQDTNERAHMENAWNGDARDIKWLWKNIIAEGQITVLAGPPGSGKSTIAASIAAIIANGMAMPGKILPGPPGVVVYWTGEDSVDATLKPRLRVAGPKTDNLIIMRGVESVKGTRPFDPAQDWPLLARDVAKLKAEGRPVKLIVIEPLAALVGRGDMNKYNDVRAALAPLVDWAEREGVAILALAHLSKGSQERAAQERVLGSTAVVGTARIVLLTRAVPPGLELGPRVLVIAKSNIGEDRGGISYASEQALVPGKDFTAPRTTWGESFPESADELDAIIRAAEGDSKSALGKAKDFVTTFLSGGKRLSNEMVAAAEREGIAKRTLVLARKALGVEPKREGGAWYASLPPGAVRRVGPEEFEAGGAVVRTPLEPPRPFQ